MAVFAEDKVYSPLEILISSEKKRRFLKILRTFCTFGGKAANAD